MSKTLKSVKDYFSKEVVAGALAFTTAFLPMTGGKLGNTFDGSALAQDTVPVKHHREMTALEKGDEARRFSIYNKGVGVFVNMAKSHEIPPEKIESGFKYRFSQADDGLGGKGIENVIYFNQSQGNITTVTFFLKGTPFEFMLGDVRSGFETVVRGYQQEQMKAKPSGDLVSSLRP